MQATLPILSQPNPPTQPPPAKKRARKPRFLEKDTINSQIELLKLVFEEIDKTEIIDRLEEDYTTGRRGYPKRSMFRAICIMYVFNFTSQNVLIDNLKSNEQLRTICGFEHLPDRRTFNRNFDQLATYADLIDDAITSIVNGLHDELPDLGSRVAIDSTAIRTYSNGNRKVVSDPDASWGYKNSSKTKGGKPEKFFGYKAHMITDVTYGIPLSVSTGKSGGNDFTTLIPMINKTEMNFDWFAPEVVIADRGYDSKKNYNFLWSKGIHPVIKNRDMTKSKNKDGTDRKNKKLYKDIFDKDGVPHCPERYKMTFMFTHPKRGHFYHCLHCSNHMWVDPMKDIRRFGTIRRASKQWDDIYSERYAVERPFKSLKQHRRLEHHTVRGKARIHLHVLLSTLTFLATVAANVKHRPDEYRVWMVPRIS